MEFPWEKVKEYLQRPVQIQNFVETEKIIEETEIKIKKGILDSAEVENALLNILQETQLHDLCFLYLVSVLIALTNKTQYLSLLLQGALCSEMLTTQNCEFIYQQVAGIVFRHPEIADKETDELTDRLYQAFYEELKSGVQMPKKKSAPERDFNRVIVMTPNFLGERHAPTHSTLERSYMLKKAAGKQVMIMSTTEGAAKKGRLPFYNTYLLNRIEQYDTIREYVWNEEKFEYFTATEPINTAEEVQRVINAVAEYNPRYVMYVGGRSYVADMINEFCPVVTVSTVFSTIPNCNTAFAMIGRKISEEERKHHGCELIEVPFSFELTEKKRDYTREELGLPEDKFILTVIGNRLDSDVSDEFLDCMEKTSGCFLLFVGGFSEYESRKLKRVWLQENSVSVGYSDDVMGVIGCADLYINPIRLGGGFSVIEGFHAGIPAVSCRYGDVSVAAGEEFCVENYDEMLSEIERYRTDREYYRKKLAQAKEREKYITDGTAGLLKGLEQMEHSERFW